MLIYGAVSRPSPQFEHLIIPYEEAFVPSAPLDTQNEPEVNLICFL